MDSTFILLCARMDVAHSSHVNRGSLAAHAASRGSTSIDPAASAAEKEAIHFGCLENHLVTVERDPKDPDNWRYIYRHGRKPHEPPTPAANQERMKPRDDYVVLKVCQAAIDFFKVFQPCFRDPMKAAENLRSITSVRVSL